MDDMELAAIRRVRKRRETIIGLLNDCITELAVTNRLGNSLMHSSVGRMQRRLEEARGHVEEEMRESDEGRGDFYQQY